MAILVVVCILMSFVFLLGGCAKRGECDECGDYANLKPFKYEGEKYLLCEDCYAFAKGLSELADLFD